MTKAAKKTLTTYGGAALSLGVGTVFPLLVIDNPIKAMVFGAMLLVIGILTIRIFGLKVIVFPDGQRVSQGQNGFDHAGIVGVVGGALCVIVGLLKWIFS